MKINDACKSVEYSDRVAQDIYSLTKLLSITGESSKSGFLGDSITGMSLDEFGNLKFDSYRETNNKTTSSTGVVLNGCVLIKQCEKEENRNHFQIYSWDIVDKTYTYLVFDKLAPMNLCFEKLRKNNINLHNVDISSKFMELGISFDDIAHVKLNQSPDFDVLGDMFSDNVNSGEDSSSFRR